MTERRLPTLAESNAPDYGRGPKEPCAGCGSTNWAWRAGSFIPFPNTCSECPASSPSSLGSPPDLKALIADVRDALNVTVDAKGLTSLAAIEQYASRLVEQMERLSGQAVGWRNIAKLTNPASGSPPAEQRVEDILAKDDLSEESCPHCGKGPLSRCTTTHHANWGDNPKVDFAADGWLCAYCGEEILTLKQADQWTMNLLKQTVSSLKEDGLTAEEAQSLLNNIGSLAVSHPHFQIASRGILTKLRRISQSRVPKK